MQTVLGLSNSATGLNQASQGAFVKGNKTLEEFSTVMDKSGARQQKFNLDVDNNFFSPMKRMIKLNYMQFAEAEQLMRAGLYKARSLTALRMEAIAPFIIEVATSCISRMFSTKLLLLKPKLSS